MSLYQLLRHIYQAEGEGGSGSFDDVDPKNVDPDPKKVETGDPDPKKVDPDPKNLVKVLLAGSELFVDEKTSKTLISIRHSFKETVAAKDAEIESLKAKIVDQPQAEKLVLEERSKFQVELDKVKKETETLKTEYESKLNKLSQAFIVTDIKSALLPVSNLDPSDKREAVLLKDAINQLSSKFKFDVDAGQLIPITDDGEPILDSKTKKPVDVQSFVAKFLQDNDQYVGQKQVKRTGVQQSRSNKPRETTFNI